MSASLKNELLGQRRRSNALAASAEGFSSSDSSRVHRDADTASSSRSRSIWTLRDYDSLPEVPPFYPIERTSAVVSCRDPGVVAERIRRALYEQSIVAEFDGHNASLFAETLDHTMFYIRLYKNGTADRGILVEIQRVEGDAFNFIKHVQIILAAARGEAANGTKAIQRRTSLAYIPASILPCYPKNSCHLDTTISACIDHVEELIKKDGLDVALLGMESLLLFTDRERSGISLYAAKAVLLGNDHHPAIREFIHACIHCPHTTLSPEDCAYDFDSRQSVTMHNTALAVLGNSLQTASHADGSALVRFLLQSEAWMGRSGIVDVLLSDLSHAEERPHDAYHSARCLSALLDLASPEEKRALIDHGLTHAMEVSQAVGHNRHSLLAQECDAALALMVDA